MTTDSNLPTVLGAEDKLTDPREWLEEVLGEQALTWAKQCNADSLRQLFGQIDPTATPLYGRFLQILESKVGFC